MPTRRVIKGVLRNFLGTFINNSPYKNRWLFGWFVHELGELRINLLSKNYVSKSGYMSRPLLGWFAHAIGEFTKSFFRLLIQLNNSSVGEAVDLAETKFWDQVHKANLSYTKIKEAELIISRVLRYGECSETGYAKFPCQRFPALVSFKVIAVMDNGKRYEWEEREYIYSYLG